MKIKLNNEIGKLLIISMMMIIDKVDILEYISLLLANMKYLL